MSFRAIQYGGLRVSEVARSSKHAMASPRRLRSWSDPSRFQIGGPPTSEPRPGSVSRVPLNLAMICGDTDSGIRMFTSQRELGHVEPFQNEDGCKAVVLRDGDGRAIRRASIRTRS